MPEEAPVTMAVPLFSVLMMSLRMG